MLAQLIATGDSEWDATPFRPDRFADLARNPERVREAATNGLRPGTTRVGPSYRIVDEAPRVDLENKFGSGEPVHDDAGAARSTLK